MAYGHTCFGVVAVISGIINKNTNPVGFRCTHREPVGDIGIVARFVNKDTETVIMTATLRNSPGRCVIVTATVHK